jgi:uncharacterized delta-60 repeat protein
MRFGRLGLSCAALVAAFVLGASQTALAASGGRDTSFGGDGLASLNGASANEDGYAVAVRNNKIVVAGYGNTGPSTDVEIARFDMSGNPDTSFGGGDGVVTVDLGGDDQVDNGLAILSDDSIVASGYSSTGAGHYKMFVLKLTPTGDPDSTFGTSHGVFVSDFGYAFGADGYDMKVVGSGKIVVAGSVYPTQTDAQMAVFQFTSKGKLDSSYGGGDGFVTKNFGSGYDEAWQITPVANGKVVVGGWIQTGASTYDVGLARFTSGGVLDATFGNHGTAEYNPTSGSDYVESMVVHNKRIVILLNSFGTSKAGFMRLTLNGKKDTSFGGGDALLFRTFSGASELHNIKFDSSGRLVVAGVGGNALYVARLKSTYAIDSSFGNSGHQTAAEASQGFGLAIQPDGKILLGGNDSSSNIAVARFLP